MTITDDLIRVHLVKDDTKSPAAPPSSRKFVSSVCKTFLASSTPDTLIGRSETREVATISVVAQQGALPTAANQTIQGISNQGSTGAAPAAGTIITSVITTQAGYYTLNWVVKILTAAADSNNVSLNVGGTSVMTAIHGTGTGIYSQLSWSGYIGAGVTINATIIATDATGNYLAQIVATGTVVNLTSPNALVMITQNEADALAATKWTGNGTIAGTLLQAGEQVQIFHNDEMWIVSVGSGTPCFVSVEAEYAH